MKDVICLAPSQVKEASALLCRAFSRDPLVQYMLPDESRRMHALPSFYRIVVRYALHYGEISTTAGVEGVACWLTPGNTTVSTWRLLRIAPAATFSFRLAEQQRNTIYSRYTDEAHERAMPGPHWYLWGLGVEPSRQHQGLGGPPDPAYSRPR